MRSSRDYVDIIGGLIMLCAGLWFMNHAFENYAIGTLRRMGPGFFPAVLGGSVAVFGVLIMLPAFFRPGEKFGFEARPFFIICIAVAAFAFLLERMGMVPTIFAMTFIASYAMPKPHPLKTLALAAALSFFAVAIFVWGLGVPLMPFRWNF